MAVTYDYRIQLTDSQRTIQESAMELLNPHFTHEPCGYIHYVTVDGDDLGCEYETCNNEECLDINKERVNKDFEGKETEFIWTNNNSDFENIELCSVCSDPLNEFMTWIGQEFDHCTKNLKTKEDIINSAFDVHALIQSFPSNDFEISQYAIHQDSIGNPLHLQKQIKARDEFVIEFMEYVNLVINELNKSGTHKISSLK